MTTKVSLRARTQQPVLCGGKFWSELGKRWVPLGEAWSDKEWFDIDDINKSASRFDFKKLDDLNAHYIRQTDDAELVRRIRQMIR